VDIFVSPSLGACAGEKGALSSLIVAQFRCQQRFIPLRINLAAAIKQSANAVAVLDAKMPPPHF
jgi:hypothetical protein